MNQANYKAYKSNNVMIVMDDYRYHLMIIGWAERVVACYSYRWISCNGSGVSPPPPKNSKHACCNRGCVVSRPMSCVFRVLFVTLNKVPRLFSLCCVTVFGANGECWLQARHHDWDQPATHFIWAPKPTPELRHETLEQPILTPHNTR